MPILILTPFILLVVNLSDSNYVCGLPSSLRFIEPVGTNFAGDRILEPADSDASSLETALTLT